jgi:hypothetical protein
MKIAICIPRYGDAKGEFTISLARMIAHSLRVPVDGRQLEIEIFCISSSNLPRGRTELLKCAMEWRARYLLWLDTDHVFPPDALLRLLRRQVDVAGCNYPRRTEPTGPVAVRIGADGAHEHVWTTAALAQADALEEVAHVGLGLCLMDMNLFHRVKAHVDKGPGWDQWEPFDRKLLPGTALRMGEDASFFHELREAGVAVHLDHGLSWEVGHIHERILTNADAEAQREAWLAARS